MLACTADALDPTDWVDIRAPGRIEVRTNLKPSSHLPPHPTQKYTTYRTYRTYIQTHQSHQSHLLITSDAIHCWAYRTYIHNRLANYELATAMATTRIGKFTYLATTPPPSPTERP